MTIKITWGSDSIVFDEDEAQGFAEALDAAGEAYSWERLGAPEPVAPATTGADWIGPGRERDAWRPLTHDEEMAAAMKAHEAIKAERQVQADAAGVPAWVLRVRAGLKAARERGLDPAYYGRVGKRDPLHGGDWYWVDQNRCYEDLPWAAEYFTPGQTTVED